MDVCTARTKGGGLHQCVLKPGLEEEYGGELTASDWLMSADPLRGVEELQKQLQVYLLLYTYKSICFLLLQDIYIWI
jgi:hypothetical protein